MPKLDEKPPQRIHIILDANEIEAIDEYSFAAKIRTRSGAIRKLIEVGLAHYQTSETKSLDEN